MVDYKKMLIIGVDIERLFSLDCLTFKSQISKSTGEVNESIFIAEYRFCKIKILKANTENPIVLFAGSIHKLWNDLNGIIAPNYNANKPYFGFNGNQFTLKDIVAVRVHLEKLFDFARENMAKRFPILVTFINKINPRSYEAHTKKLKLEVIKEFSYNNNNYYELVYDTSKKLKNL